MARGGELGLPRSRRGGGVRHQPSNCGARRAVERPVGASLSRARAWRDRRLWPECALDVQRHRRDRELRRDLRAQPRPEDAARDGARAQQALERRGPDVLAAIPVVRTRWTPRVVGKTLAIGIVAAALWWVGCTTQRHL